MGIVKFALCNKKKTECKILNIVKFNLALPLSHKGNFPGCLQFDEGYVIQLQQTLLIQLDRMVNVSAREMRLEEKLGELNWCSPQTEGSTMQDWP